MQPLTTVDPLQSHDNDPGNRRAYGRHLTYVAKDDMYTMVGTPAKVYDDLPPNCKYTEAATVTFHKAGNSTAAAGKRRSRYSRRSRPP